ncbi:hypothetical protein [Cellulomonas sp. Y8]|uniref:hypothetical protein n=1 Tax=Cellulomonas sp. Y8 TaxID=2591145 RepID=UPI003D72F3D7
MPEEIDHQARLDAALADYRSTAELAEALGVKPASIRSRMYRERLDREARGVEEVPSTDVELPVADLFGLINVWHVDQVRRMQANLPRSKGGRPKGSADRKPRRSRAGQGPADD